MKFDILTLFPEMFDNVLNTSIIGRAVNNGLVNIQYHQIRDYTENKQKQVDDYPYGGGWGCVMMAQPLKSCLDDVIKNRNIDRSKIRVIFMSPQGKTFNQETAKRLSSDYEDIILVCGHYEGVDERFIEKCVDEEISIGDFVLTGGEIAAMAITDSVCRLLPGVLSDEQCYIGESHWDGLLEYPQFTRPEIWEGMKVPDVLLEGDHEKIDRWRHIQQLQRTKEKRQDMFDKLNLTDEEIKLLSRPKLNVSYRLASRNDINDILSIIKDAKNILSARNIDQWQGEYPARSNFENDINDNCCYVICNDGKIAGVFTVIFGEIDEYNNISDGKWYSDTMFYCSLHRVAISKEFYGSGLSEYIIRYSEEICDKNGCRCIRTDTHRKNKAFQKVLSNNGFRYRGNVNVDCEPGHETLRRAYEKILKK